MNETIDLLMSHMSIRKFKAQNVEEEKVRTIIEAAQWSATSSHFQAYSIINVKDQNKRQIIADAAGGQKWVVECPLFLVFCADLNRSKKSWQGIDVKTLENTDMFLVATVDAALAAQKAFIAAQSLGLGGVYIGGIRNDLNKVSEILQLPELVYAVFGMCLGYPNQNPGEKPRLPLEVVYKVDSYDDSMDKERIDAYDEVIRQYYKERSGGKIQDTWTERCGKYMMEKPREYLGEFLKSKGFCEK